MRKSILFFGLLILGLSGKAQYNITLKSTLSIGTNGYSNIWGYKQGNKEYALLGCTGSSSMNDACAIIDVSSPTQPVTLFKVPGPRSTWREIRTWQHYAYITTEGADTTFGVTIVDLQYLPDSIKTKQYTAGGKVGDVHSLHIDNGYLYLYGGSNTISKSGALILNLSDPWNPTVAGAYTTHYVHDGMVKNNKLYAGEIYGGNFAIIDVSNKSNPVILNTQVTPYAFTHNTWLSTNNNFLFTTDEKSDAYVAAYDVSDPQNITEVDRYRHNNSNGSIPHNTYILNDSLATGFNTDFLLTSYYTDGVTIVDAARPDNLVEVGHYDTSPLSGNNFKGAWGVYSYLPSGNILVSDMNLGMFTLKPDYMRACYLEGTITDASNNLAVPNATVKFLANGQTKSGKLSGVYKTGLVTQGTQDVLFSAPGYQDKVVTVNLVRAQVVTQNVQLSPIGFGAENQHKQAVSIYPSIVKNELCIEQDKLNSLHLKLIDLNGKLILEKSISSNKEKVDVSNMNSGTYIVQLFDNNEIVKSVKIIKE